MTLQYVELEAQSMINPEGWARASTFTAYFPTISINLNALTGARVFTSLLK
jgi:hypothetical protein